MEMVRGEVEDGNGDMEWGFGWEDYGLRGMGWEGDG